jgi:hypothetical protein
MSVLAEIQPVVALMPLFVWIAIAIAVVLIGAGEATNAALEPLARAVNGPTGYVLLGLLAVLIGWSIYRKRRSS